MRTLSTSTATKLFSTGFIVGPIVDSLHNQCLLRYDILPVSVQWPTTGPASSMASLLFGIDSNPSIIDHHYYPYFFCSSWTVPPLLGIAYLILGGVLPRIVESILLQVKLKNEQRNSKTMATTTPDIIDTSSSSSSSYSSTSLQQKQKQLQTRAILAVTTTAIIIKLSEYLETHHDILFVDDTTTTTTSMLLSYLNIYTHSEASLLVMLMAAIIQWVVLDGSIIALLVATLTAIGGPISELPFVGHGVWTYLDEAANYFPLQNININNILQQLPEQLPQIIFGTSNYHDLASSTITGPCYFAVAMDAIALGRWFDSLLPSSSSSSYTLSDTDKIKR
jgi:hypothetical protein